MRLYIDLETYSECDLQKSGSYKYAEHPTTEITLFGYAIGDEPAKVWDITTGARMPADLAEALARDDVQLWAHNAMFDRVILKTILGAPFDNLDKWCDSMIAAYSVSLPGALGALSEVLGLPQDKAKDKDGRRLVLKFCKPTKEGTRHTRETDPEDWAKFVNYCRLDVEAMRETVARIPKWNCTESMWADWRCDQAINDRGIPVDLDLVNKAIECAAEVKADADKSIQEATNGSVGTAQQRDELLKYMLSMYGVTLPDMRKDTLERRLNDESLPEPVKELLALRLQAAVASVKKFDALGRATCADGRLRGTMQFMGASRTGRFAGRIFQPQNLPRGDMKPEAVETAIDAIKHGLLTVVYDNPNRVLSNCIRGCVCAKEGNELIVADLSNIEGRVLAWLAGERWKINAFEEFDAGRGPDLYKATYARTFGIKPEEVTKKQRQIGKVLELGLGYQGGVGAFITFAGAYGVDLDELAEHTIEAIDSRYWEEALSSYEWALEIEATHGLKQNTWVACDAIKRAWREAHPAISRFWYDVEAAMIAATKTGKKTSLGKIKVLSPAEGWVAVVLPSGRGVCYPSCKLPENGERCAITYAGTNQYAKKWGRVKTYGGKCVENITQAVARDVLMAGLRNATDLGMNPVMHIHDEIVCECPKGKFTEEDLAKCMTTGIPWTKGLPLAAAGFTATRYRKD